MLHMIVLKYFLKWFLLLCTCFSPPSIDTQKTPSYPTIHGTTLTLWSDTDLKASFLKLYLLHLTGILYLGCEHSLWDKPIYILMEASATLISQEVFPSPTICLILQKGIIILLAVIKSSPVPQFYLISLVFAKDCKRPEILPDLKANKILYHSFQMLVKDMWVLDFRSRWQNR